MGLTALTTAVCAEPIKNKLDHDIINCHYVFNDTSDVKLLQNVTAWAKQAAQQTFSFKNKQVSDQLSALKSCYTQEGWASFNAAFLKSGNLDAIQQQAFDVESKIQGTAYAKKIQGKQWQVTLPMQIVYQNKKEKIIQELNVQLLIAMQGDNNLGIVQIVAAPQQILHNNPQAVTAIDDNLTP